MDNASRLFDSKKSSVAQRSMKPAQTGTAQVRAPERVSGASADTPPLLIQTRLPQSYHAGQHRLALHHSDEESELDPSDFDENVVSPKPSGNSMSQDQNPHNSSKPLPAQAQATPTAKASVVSWKSLASIFFRSPDPRGTQVRADPALTQHPSKRRDSLNP